MRKILFIAAGVLLSFNTAQSQEIRFGAKAGLNISNIGGDEKQIEYTARTSFHIGGFVEIPLMQNFAVQPEILFSSQGAKVEEDLSFDIQLEGTTKLEYIQVPVMAKYYVAEGFAIEAGPQFSYLVQAIGDYEITRDSQSESRKVELTDISKIDFAMGLGASYMVEDSGLFFAARYNFGLTNLNDGESASDSKSYNRVLQVSVGYSF